MRNGTTRSRLSVRVEPHNPTRVLRRTQIKAHGARASPHSPVQKRRCRAGIRAGHVAVVALRLGVRRLLLVVEHLLAKVRAAVLFELRLRKAALVRGAAIVLR